MSKFKENAVLKVTYKGTGKNNRYWKWYRVNRGRNIETVVNGFLNSPHFMYAKAYSYNRNSKTVGHELGYFGKNEETGEIYHGGMF